jgi:hypothetical protein
VKAYTEKRDCRRFGVPGATLRFKKEISFFAKGHFSAATFPLFDISQKGLRFFADHRLENELPLIIEIAFGDETTRLVINGRVRWTQSTAKGDYPYIIGVVFHPFGHEKGQNPPERLQRLIALEKRLAGETHVE